MWQALSTSNDIIFNLIWISLPKLWMKEPASQILYTTTAVDCRQCKSPHNNTKSTAINFGRERRRLESLSFHEYMALSRWEASLRPARAWRSRGHFCTVSVRSKLPPLCVLVSPSPVWREATRDFVALDRTFDDCRVQLRTSVSAHPRCPKI